MARKKWVSTTYLYNEKAKMFKNNVTSDIVNFMNGDFYKWLYYTYILQVYKGWSKIIGINKMYKSNKWFIKLVAAI